LEAHLRGEPEKSKRKGKKSKGNRRDNAERIRDEVADFPDTPDMREPRQSSEDDEVARATAALIADAPRLNWADEVPTPPAVDPRQLQRARYSPSRVRADEYGVQGYDPTNFRDNMETDE
jgi:predicted RNase H-like nuclease